MSETGTLLQELGLPAASLLALRRAIEAELGPDAAARALQHAGHAAGDALFAAASGGASFSELGQTEFWRRVGALFAERGWGSLQFEPVHSGVGSLETSDWAESDPGSSELGPSCHFTTGLLANLLGRTAGQEVGVMEIECRSRGDLRCRFLFGGQTALERVYAALTRGSDLDRSLAELS